MLIWLIWPDEPDEPHWPNAQLVAQGFQAPFPLGRVGEGLVSNMPSFSLQKAAFYALKDGFLHRDLPPFALRPTHSPPLEEVGWGLLLQPFTTRPIQSPPLGEVGRGFGEAGRGLW